MKRSTLPGRGKTINLNTWEQHDCKLVKSYFRLLWYALTCCRIFLANNFRYCGVGDSSVYYKRVCRRDVLFPFSCPFFLHIPISNPKCEIEGRPQSSYFIFLLTWKRNSAFMICLELVLASKGFEVYKYLSLSTNKYT